MKLPFTPSIYDTVKSVNPACTIESSPELDNRSPNGIANAISNGFLLQRIVGLEMNLLDYILQH
jgi:hypothetical protein